MKCRQLALVGLSLAISLVSPIANARGQEVNAQQRLQMYEGLMSEASELGKKYSQLGETSTERDGLRSTIRDVLTRAFDLRQRIQREEVAAARAELDEVEKRVVERDKLRDDIIRRKQEELVAGGNLQWPTGTSLRQAPHAARDLINPGDVVAIYIEGVLPFNPPNQPPVPPPVTKLDSGALVTGYPIVVTSDGTIQLPLLAPLKVDGLSIREAEKMIATAYVENDILRPEKARPMATLVPAFRTVDSILQLPDAKKEPVRRR